jgi:predicted transposase/invertase (TIGR01784 family)
MPERRTPLIARPKIDVVFKKLFTENPELLKDLIRAAIDLPKIDKITLKPTEVVPNDPRDKFCRLDVLVNADGREIDVEVQLNDRGDFRSRALYYWALLFSSLRSGDNYETLPQTIIISILDFNLFKDSAGYHSVYEVRERETNRLLSDKLQLHFFELKKIPDVADAKSDIEYWLHLIRAETEEEIETLENAPNTVIKTALDRVKILNADGPLKAQVISRETAIREERSALSSAHEEGIKQGIKEGIKEGASEERRENIKKLLKIGMGLEKILEALEITDEEYEELKDKL